MRNDNDDLDYEREESQRRAKRQLQQQLICRDPFYPQAWHEQEVLESVKEWARDLED